MPRRAQFSLRLLLAAVPAVAAPLGVLVAKPSWYSGLGMMLLAVTFPPVLWIGARQAGTYGRAFCVGALAPALTAATFIAFSLITVNGPETVSLADCLAVVGKLAEFYRFLLAFFWACMPVVGTICVAASWAFRAQ